LGSAKVRLMPATSFGAGNLKGFAYVCKKNLYGRAEREISRVACPFAQFTKLKAQQNKNNVYFRTDPKVCDITPGLRF